MGFFLEVLIGGLMSGVLYALVALGFVLIFKASGVLRSPASLKGGFMMTKSKSLSARPAATRAWPETVTSATSTEARSLRCALPG